jgi:hypothetical protein
MRIQVMIENLRLEPGTVDSTKNPVTPILNSKSINAIIPTNSDYIIPSEDTSMDETIAVKAGSYHCST